MAEKNKARKILHVLIVVEFLIGPIILAAIFYWLEFYNYGHIAIGLFLVWSFLYYRYGIDYFEVDFLKKG